MIKVSEKQIGEMRHRAVAIGDAALVLLIDEHAVLRKLAEHLQETHGSGLAGCTMCELLAKWNAP